MPLASGECGPDPHEQAPAPPRRRGRTPARTRTWRLRIRSAALFPDELQGSASGFGTGRERPEGIEPSSSVWKTDVSAEFTTTAGRALARAQW